MEPTAAQMQQAITIGRLILAIVPLATIASAAIAFWNARRKPSLSEELYRDFVSRSACDARHCREAADRSASISEINARLEEGNKLFRTLERALGRIEGVLDNINKK
jgi:hypothetical protein